jgi:predicted unusual protein kinase regulating ubiquinone biosynthesis (AarF/ABC1/UbiB family)
MLAGIAGETALEALRRLGGGGEEGSVVLTRANAQRVTDTLSNLRGAAMKLGQMLSLHGDDLLPPEFVQILSAVRNQAHFMPEDQVRAVLVRELGADWESKFAEFDFEPLAAASIGQVHDARGPDGAELALKIQYPGVDRSIGSDVDNLAVLLRVTRLLPAELELDPLLEEVKQELKREADYRREADNTERYGELCRDEPAVLVPGVHRSLSSRRVLATDRVFGLPIEDLRSPEHSQERRDRIGERLLGLVLRLFDPNNERIALLDFGAARRFTRKFTDAYRRLLVASVDDHRPALFEVSRELGFLKGDETPEALDIYVELLRLLTEPLRAEQPYDFRNSDLARRARETSLEALAHHRLPNPPSETLFLHRKLGGSFLLAAHIGAVVDTRALYRRFVLRA